MHIIIGKLFSVRFVNTKKQKHEHAKCFSEPELACYCCSRCQCLHTWRIMVFPSYVCKKMDEGNRNYRRGYKKYKYDQALWSGFYPFFDRLILSGNVYRNEGRSRIRGPCRVYGWSRLGFYIYGYQLSV